MHYLSKNFLWKYVSANHRKKPSVSRCYDFQKHEKGINTTESLWSLLHYDVIFYNTWWRHLSVKPNVLLSLLKWSLELVLSSEAHPGRKQDAWWFSLAHHSTQITSELAPQSTLIPCLALLSLWITSHNSLESLLLHKETWTVRIYNLWVNTIVTCWKPKYLGSCSS